MNWLNSVYTDGSKYFVSNPLPKKQEEITIFIRILKNDELKHIILRTKLNGIEKLFEMKYCRTEKGLDYYSCSLVVYEAVLHYHFYLVTNKEIYYYNQLEITNYIPNELYDFKILVDYSQPTWVKEGVFYQIFTERFYNGNPNNDVTDGEYTFDGHKTIKVKEWESVPLNYNKTFCLDFYGGDLEGVKEKIPYLKKLGVTSLYLNPIFYAATVHKYDCLDYFNVDPHFGGNKALEELTNELHKNGMRIILDTSINHTGSAHKWFNKDCSFFDKSVGAYHNKNSKERNYYFFKKNNEYVSWLGVSTLPTLNYTSKELREIIYLGSDSVVKKWLKKPYNIDGWRFDVADIMARNDMLQLHHVVWPEIRKSIKEENKEAYLLAEDWSDCDEFLKGDEWDSSMNYFGFTRPIREFVGEVDLFNRRNNLLNFNINSTGEMTQNRIKAHLCKLPFSIQENQFNLLDSHDVPRLHNNNNIRHDHYIGAVVCMFTMIGTPSIYYGDELAIDGDITTTEGCRYPMPWSKNIDSLESYKLYSKLAHLKTTKDCLKYGGIKFFVTEGRVLAYSRFTLDELMIIIFSVDNHDQKVNLPLKNFGKDLVLPNIDLLDNKIEYKVLNDEVQINVKAHMTYLINL